jgi:hypothetical protein
MCKGLSQRKIPKKLLFSTLSNLLLEKCPIFAVLLNRNSTTIESRGNADVVKLVDTLDLGSSAARCVGSSPSIRTEE